MHASYIAIVHVQLVNHHFGCQKLNLFWQILGYYQVTVSDVMFSSRISSYRTLGLTTSIREIWCRSGVIENLPSELVSFENRMLLDMVDKPKSHNPGGGDAVEKNKAPGDKKESSKQVPFIQNL